MITPMETTQHISSTAAEAPATQDAPLIIVMHASVGSGHRSAAQAIAQSFEQLRGQFNIPENARIEVLDCLDFGRCRVDGNKAATMFTGATRPIYDITWRYTLTGHILWGGGTIWSRLFFPAFTNYVKESQPIAIVTTHITAANIAVGARMITGQNYPIVCVPTDYETEGLWPHKCADLFCVATESMAETLRPRKVPEERICITGLPTKLQFQKEFDPYETRSSLHLPHDKKIVLALAGAYLPKPYVHFRSALDEVLPYLHSLPNLHLVVIAGADKNYANHLRRTCADLHIENASVLEYVNNMAALMSASDLVVCKSGGLTVTECLCAEVPMVLLGRSYGQEKINVRMLTSLGAAMHATTYRELLEILRHYSDNPNIMNAVKENERLLRKPDAALRIAKKTMELVTGEIPTIRDTRAKHFIRFYWGKRPAHGR